ncbi:response regulator [Pseudomonas fungipugnans]|uniref:response regulator n=1 Tax=Pseudomonas fungipugnans TaxID=3024217 RepID=UPI003D715E12
MDDSAMVLETMKMLLEMEDAEVVAIDQPLAALDAARSMSFNLIISDLGMPVMSGHELMSALRQLPQVKDIPASSDVRKSREPGFNHHIGKPVAYDDLIEIIETLCGAHDLEFDTIVARRSAPDTSKYCRPFRRSVHSRTKKPRRKDHFRRGF